MADPGWTQYKLQQALFSMAEDFWIENERGEAVYKVDGKLLHVRKTFVLEDRNGTELATIKAKLLALNPTMTIERNGQAYAKVKKVPFTLFHGEYTIDSSDGRALRAKGDFTHHEYEVHGGDQLVATISRRWFAVHNTYGIAIAPGLDEVLLLAAAVCIDEMEEHAREQHH